MQHDKLFNSILIKKAFYYAAEKHDGQYRKGTKTPFFVHPSLVALGVSEYTNNENTIVAAVLHDVIEDCEVSTEELSNEFNKEISKIVKCLSLPQINKREKKEWRNRKKRYIELITNASEDVLLIVAVDKMFNMKTYFNYAITKNIKTLNKLFSGTVGDYLWYYGEIAKVIDSKLGNHPVTKDYNDMLQYFTNILKN